MILGEMLLCFKMFVMFLRCELVYEDFGGVLEGREDFCL